MDITSVADENLKNKQVFSVRREIAAIPTETFLIIGLSVLFVFILNIYFLGWLSAFLITPLFAGIVYMPMYIVHKDDPLAYKVWLRGLIDPLTLTTGRYTPRKVRIIENRTRKQMTLIEIYQSNHGD